MSYFEKSYPTDQLRIYSLLFTRSELDKVVSDDDTSVVDFCMQEYDHRNVKKMVSYGDYYKYAYRVMQKYHADEYLYKNELLNKVLYRQYSHDECHIYSELNLGNVIADLVLFDNGRAVGYEIKTGLDNPAKLSKQLPVYSKVFNDVYVVVPLDKTDLYTDFADGRIGLIAYDPRNLNFKTIRKSSPAKGPSPRSLMQVLRTKEYRYIVETYYGKEVLEHSTAFSQFDDCSELISAIPEGELNRLFIEVMTNRCPCPPRYNKKYTEFNQVLVAHRGCGDSFKERLAMKLNRPISN